MNRFSSEEHSKDILAFQNYAWDKSSQYYDVLVGRISSDQLVASGKSVRQFWESIDWDKVDEYLKTLEESKQFQIILEQTQQYLNFCQKQWEENYSQSSEVIKSLTNFDLSKSMQVYITHPSLKNGMYYGDNIIGWGHHEDWPNYTTVYLWHEILHSYLGYSELEHTLIQLITDNELRVQLNGGSYPPFVGYENLNSLTEKILPYWKEYLLGDNKNIYGLKTKLEEENILLQ